MGLQLCFFHCSSCCDTSNNIYHSAIYLHDKNILPRHSQCLSPFSALAIFQQTFRTVRARPTHKKSHITTTQTALNEVGPTCTEPIHRMPHARTQQTSKGVRRGCEEWQGRTDYPSANGSQAGKAQNETTHSVPFLVFRDTMSLLVYLSPELSMLLVIIVYWLGDIPANSPTFANSGSPARFYKSPI